MNRFLEILGWSRKDSNNENGNEYCLCIQLWAKLWALFYVDYPIGSSWACDCHCWWTVRPGLHWEWGNLLRPGWLCSSFSQWGLWRNESRCPPASGGRMNSPLGHIWMALACTVPGWFITPTHMKRGWPGLSLTGVIGRSVGPSPEAQRELRETRRADCVELGSDSPWGRAWEGHPSFCPSSGWIVLLLTEWEVRGTCAWRWLAGHWAGGAAAVPWPRSGQAPEVW